MTNERGVTGRVGDEHNQSSLSPAPTRRELELEDALRRAQSSELYLRDKLGVIEGEAKGLADKWRNITPDNEWQRSVFRRCAAELRAIVESSEAPLGSEPAEGEDKSWMPEHGYDSEPAEPEQGEHALL